MTPPVFTNCFFSVTHKIYKSFDDGLEVTGVFLDISKAFDMKYGMEGYFSNYL